LAERTGHRNDIGCWEDAMAMHRRVLAKLVSIALITAVGSVAAHAQSTIKIDGSMGSMPLVQALAKAYQAKQPTVTIQFGSGLNPKARIEALVAGTIDIALASHGLDLHALNRQGLPVTEIARTAVVFAANASANVAGLTNDQACGIYAGRIANWKELGGPDLAIAAHARPESEVDTEVVRDGVGCLKGLAFAPSVKIVRRSSDMAKSLAETSGALGVTTTTVVEQSGGKIRALALNGVVANEANVSAGKYAIVREVFLVTKGASTPAVQGFIAFIRSPEGAAVIKANSAIPTAARS
jgi:phosphate transport system substrate-binding protein